MFFFFKQKMAYELRISDWSSDVCSSDLACCCVLEDGVAAPLVELPAGPPFPIRIEHPSGVIELLLDADAGKGGITLRSAGTLRTARKLMRGEVYVPARSEEHTSELQSLLRISYGVVCLTKKIEL